MKLTKLKDWQNPVEEYGEVSTKQIIDIVLQCLSAAVIAYFFAVQSKPIFGHSAASKACLNNTGHYRDWIDEKQCNQYKAALDEVKQNRFNYWVFKQLTGEK